MRRVRSESCCDSIEGGPLGITGGSEEMWTSRRLERAVNSCKSGARLCCVGLEKTVCPCETIIGSDENGETHLVYTSSRTRSPYPREPLPLLQALDWRSLDRTSADSRGSFAPCSSRVHDEEDDPVVNQLAQGSQK